MCCESNSEERSAGNPHATFCGGWGIQRMPLLPGLGHQLGSPFYPAELEIELVATTPALYSTESLNTTFLTGGIWKKEGFFL